MNKNHTCYGKKSFKSEPERLEFLFGLYKEYLQEDVEKSLLIILGAPN